MSARLQGMVSLTRLTRSLDSNGIVGREKRGASAEVLEQTRRSLRLELDIRSDRLEAFEALSTPQVIQVEPKASRKGRSGISPMRDV